MCPTIIGVPGTVPGTRQSAFIGIIPVLDLPFAHSLENYIQHQQDSFIHPLLFALE